MAETADIDIAICTFQRDHITQTMQSLGRIRVPDRLRLRVIVVDNDDTPSAQARVVGQDWPFPVTYLHAPGRNIAIARNACLDAATAPRLVFIDDDELVTRRWLEALIFTQNASKAAVVLGPVRAIYPSDSPRWMVVGDHHATQPVFVAGEIRTGYSCNALLMREAPSIAGLRFSRALGRSGGEDTFYFAQIHARGGRIAFAPDAEVKELVPDARASLRWLLRRKFRFGHTHGLVLRAGVVQSPLRRMGGLALAAGKCVFCYGMVLLTVPSATNRVAWLLRGTLHAGVAFQFLGGQSQDIYGKDQPA